MEGEKGDVLRAPNRRPAKAEEEGFTCGNCNERQKECTRTINSYEETPKYEVEVWDSPIHQD